MPLSNSTLQLSSPKQGSHRPEFKCGGGCRRKERPKSSKQNCLSPCLCVLADFFRQLKKTGPMQRIPVARGKEAICRAFSNFGSSSQLEITFTLTASHLPITKKLHKLRRRRQTQLCHCESQKWEDGGKNEE